ncbi:20576_t:CDS:2 [Gigaspora margarita]|uniref:20576_t:CDS:1 n=1 Tax=Gigaspora margarita TaxID=4874 RepID=A0ABM8W0T3_GIGMA|nr:20576_t:CDS:2 [Gigaspora margarita]
MDLSNSYKPTSEKSKFRIYDNKNATTIPSISVISKTGYQVATLECKLKIQPNWTKTETEDNAGLGSNRSKQYKQRFFQETLVST